MATIPGAGRLENDSNDLYPNTWSPQILRIYEKKLCTASSMESEDHSGLGCPCGPKCSHKCLCQGASEVGQAHEENCMYRPKLGATRSWSKQEGLLEPLERATCLHFNFATLTRQGC